MRFEIITRQSRSATAPEIPHSPFDGRPVNRTRMIEIDICAPRGRRVRTVAIEVIQGNAYGPRAKGSLKFAGQPAFARAAAAHNGDEASLVTADPREILRFTKLVSHGLLARTFLPGRKYIDRI